MTGPNYRGLAWIAAGLVASIAILYALQRPELFLVYLGIGIVLFGGGALTVAIGMRHERDEARAELARRDREDAARMESRLLSGETVPSLRIVRSPIPMQRRSEEWDAIVRAVEEEGR